VHGLLFGTALIAAEDSIALFDELPVDVAIVG
jgi:hypothetical protein